MFRKVALVSFVIAGAFLGSNARADDPQEISKGIVSTPELVNQGKALFTGNCASCHGNEGKGDGPAAVAFNPKPRNFATEQFKQGSSPAAVFMTITNGLGSMPSFASLPVADRLAVVHYVLSLSPNRSKDSAEVLEKLGLDASGKPIPGFKVQEKIELPVEFIIERMATDGDVKTLNAKDLETKMAALKEASKPAVAAVLAPNMERGEELFNSCIPCHGDAGQGTHLAKAPQIAGQDLDYLISNLKKFQNGARGAHPDDVNGLKMRPMSRMLRTEEDVVSVANYVHSLPPQKLQPTIQGGDVEKGKIAFTTCIACHGPDAKGLKALNGPALVNLPDWYVVNQIHSFKAGWRGTNPGDVNGSTMRGMAMTIPDEQTVKDIAAYLNSLQ